MYSNYQGGYISQIRSQLTLLVLPLQYILDKPIKFVHWIENSFSSQQEVLAENARLRARQLLLEAKLQKLLGLELENVELRQLLSASSRFSEHVLVAQMLNANLDPLNQEVLLDKGSREGVYVGQPVLDAYGIIGQVIDVSPLSSRVLLVTDGRSAIPVQNNRNGVRAIVTGTGYPDELNLLHMTYTADVKVGDLFVTSGLGGRFPFGYPVGAITKIVRTSGERFALITLKPSSHVDRARLVILIWPAKDQEELVSTGTMSTPASASPVPPAASTPAAAAPAPDLENSDPPMPEAAATPQARKKTKRTHQ